MSAAPHLDPQIECCFHCGEALDADDTVFESIGDEVRGFCCHGCLGATALIHELGLSAFYERRDPPAGQRPPPDPGTRNTFERFDDPRLQRSFATIESNGERSATLGVGGMRCAACSWLLEERLARVSGVSDARFGLASQRARVRWDPTEVKLSEILARIAELGYRAAPFEPDAEEERVRAERRAALRRLGVAGLGTMQVMMFSVALYAGAFGDLERAHRDLLRFASWIVATPVLAYSGFPFLAGAYRNLRAARVGPDVPIALALMVAYVASAWATRSGSGEVYFDSVCMFVFFITLGRTIERDLRARAELRIRGFLQRVPQVAHRLEAGRERDVPVADLRESDLLTILPGETLPADGIVVGGSSEVNESLLTGEASPVSKRPGSPLLAGSRNFDGTLCMRVERTGAASTLQRIATLLDRAEFEKSPISELAQRLARIFVSLVLVVAALVGLVWWQIDPSRVVPIVVAVLIATCPCALSLATPAALAAATHGLAARGFLITRGHALEALARVTRVVFDKTGTLTAATPALLAVRPVREGVDATRALQLAARLEAGSTHPIARALLAASTPGSAAGVMAARNLRAELGAGVAGELDGTAMRLGQPDWSAALTGKAPEPRVDTQDSTASTVLLADARGAIAWFDLDTRLRPGAASVASWLERNGYACSLLSGDPSSRGVEEVARRLTVRDAHADASPEAKLRAVDAWIASGDTVMAVGDGVNDVPLLGRAQISVAMGSGSDLAQLRADAVLLDDRLESLPMALCWARRARRTVHQNFAWALAYNLCVLPLAAIGLLPPYVAAAGMSLSSLLVVGNSLRLRRAPRRVLEDCT